jgi:GntR family transcriptional regulator
MFDIQHDSRVPIHEQIAEQIRTHIASGALKPGARLAEYRALAQELLTNPQSVARAYVELETEEVLKKDDAGAMEITPGAALTCRLRLQDSARIRIHQAIAQAFSAGLAESEVRHAIELGLAAAKNKPLTEAEAATSIKTRTEPAGERSSQAIQDISRQPERRSAPADDPGHFRPARGEHR